MGQHYVPQEYLRGFATFDDPDMIWIYLKGDRLSKRVPIKGVAQAAGFYTAEVEAELSARLEGPAHGILARLRNRETITEEQRIHFAIYMATMMKRVPRRRRISREDVLPKALKATVEGFLADLNTWAATTSNHALAAQRFADVERIRKEFEEEPPKQITDQIESPWPTLRMIEAISTMTWRLVSTTGPQLFATSDNPAFFFEGLGIGQPNSEVTFPLSTKVALLGSRQGHPGDVLYVEVTQKVVREINRRIVAGSERMILAHQAQPWIAQLADKSHLYLSRIQW